MLRDADAVATLAVKDLDKAARFYEETLGLRRADSEEQEALVFESGETTINVYRSSFAGTNKATGLTPGARATCTSPAISGWPGSRTRTATS